MQRNNPNIDELENHIFFQADINGDVISILYLDNRNLDNDYIIHTVVPFLESHPEIGTINISRSSLEEAGAAALASVLHVKTIRATGSQMSGNAWNMLSAKDLYSRINHARNADMVTPVPSLFFLAGNVVNKVIPDEKQKLHPDIREQLDKQESEFGRELIKLKRSSFADDEIEERLSKRLKK